VYGATKEFHKYLIAASVLAFGLAAMVVRAPFPVSLIAGVAVYAGGRAMFRRPKFRDKVTFYRNYRFK
jgi:hypothetical protein